MRDQQAVKVVCGAEHVEMLRLEHARLTAHAQACQCQLVVRPSAFIDLPDAAGGGFCMTPVGSAITREGLLSSNKFPQIIDVFKVLSALHQHGYAHGDARLANLVVLQNTPPSLCWIDFRTSFHQDAGQTVLFQADMKTLFKSIASSPAGDVSCINEQVLLYAEGLRDGRPVDQHVRELTTLCTSMCRDYGR